MLKKAVREPVRSIKLATAGQMFRLLEAFGNIKNQAAPVLYKSLVFSLIENPIDDTIREFFLVNFKVLFAEQPTIPVSLFLEPWLKQIVNQVQRGMALKTFDFEFLQLMANHPKLSSAVAPELMSLLCKLYYTEVSFC
jgi:hypothetical protein